MSNFKIKLNRSGVGQLLKSDEMKELLKSKAEEIKTRCGDGFETDVYSGKNRANASIRPATKKAKSENMKNNTLLKAVR